MHMLMTGALEAFLVGPDGRQMRGDTQTRFGAEFAQAFEVHRAISEVVSESAEGSGLIDAAEVVRRLLAEHPADITLTPAELAEAVVRAAADAGVRVAYRAPTP
jgi:hypothetical protein